MQGKKKAWAILGAVVALAVMGVLCFVVGKPIIDFVSQPEGFRQWVEECGLWARAAFVGMMALQVVVAFIPGEPLEIGAGYAFGAIEGTILCLLGALVGGITVFLFVKRFGMCFVGLFFPPEKVGSLQFLQNERKLNLVAYILFLIPGTPKDLMTYVVGLTPMRLPFWVFLSLTARIPSVITSTIGGDALGSANYAVAVWVFAVTAALSGVGLLVYRYMAKKRRKGEA